MFVLERSIVIHRPCSAVYQYIRQPGSVAALQPLVIGLEHDHDHDHDHDHEPENEHGSQTGASLRYRAIESVPIAGGLLRLRNVIHVEQINDDAGARVVKSLVQVEGPVSIGGRFALTGVQTLTLVPVDAAGEGAESAGPQQSTLVVDRFEFQHYPRPLRRFIEATASQARETLLARLKATLEAPPHEQVFPSGWFAACPIAELPHNGVLLRTLLGQMTLLSKTPTGQLLCARVPSRYVSRLRDATWHGVRLVGRGLTLRFDGSFLVAEQDDSAPIAVQPVHAFMGLLLFWHAADGSRMQPFPLPEWSSELTTPYKFRYFPRTVHTTVKEITEDIADCYHFGEGGHAWRDLVVHKFDTSSEICTLDMSFTMETSVFGRFRDEMRMDSHFEAIGVGLFIGTVKNAQRDLDSRPLICYTPTTSPRHIQLIYGESHRRMEAPARLHKLFGLVPRPVADYLISLQSLRAMQKDVTDSDVRRWETDSYLQERRARTDHLLTDYRRWVSRFYSEATRPTVETASQP